MYAFLLLFLCARNHITILYFLISLNNCTFKMFIYKQKINIMIIRNLQSIERNIVLGMTLITAVVFTSCSRTLTSLRSSEKLQNQQVLLTKPSEVTVPQTAVVFPKEQSPSVLQKADKVELVQAAKKHKFSMWANSQSHFIIQKSTLVKNTIVKTVDNQMASVKSMSKNNNQMSDNHSAQPMRDLIRTGIMCIVIALVLYLIAWLLFFADPISTLFYVLATIFLVVGILFLLFGLLRMM